MTSDANNDRSRRDADATPEEGHHEPNTPDSEQPGARPRLGWSDSAVEDSSGGASRRDDGPQGSSPPVREPDHGEAPTIKGTPTPGVQTPTGRPEDSPNVVARPLTGTTPKATNDRPQVPRGSGDTPTPARPVEEGRRGVAPDFRPASDAASAHTPAPEVSSPGRSGDDASGVRAADNDGTPASGERPENPFAPREEAARTSRTARARKRRPEREEEEQGKRIDASSKRFGLGRVRGGHKDRVSLGTRNVAALTVAGIAVVAIVALIASTALWWFNRDPEVAGPPAPDLSATPGPVLSAGQMLSETMAKEIDPSRTWTQTLDQAGVNDSSPGIACIGPLAAGQPIPEITQLRGLSASGDDRTAALHRADAYVSNDEAQEVFDFRSAELGACTDTPLYVENGMTVTGIGDQALGVRLVLQDEKPEYHTVLLVRTGRVVNLLDVVRLGDPVDLEAQVTALGRSVDRQCGPAVGLCTAPTTSVGIGVPPAGGEQPGFLTAGDIPRVTPGSGSWRGSPISTQIDVQDGSSCEAVDLSSIGGSGVTRQQRTYLLRNDAAAPPQFGIDQVVLTMGSSEEAQQLVSRIDDNMSSCGTRTLTSRMTKEAPLVTPGQGDVEVRGHWYVVESKVDQVQSQTYRVGVFRAGDRFVYLRANPSATFDFTDEAWIGVNLRAGERITQVD